MTAAGFDVNIPKNRAQHLCIVYNTLNIAAYTNNALDI